MESRCGVLLAVASLGLMGSVLGAEKPSADNPGKEMDAKSASAESAEVAPVSKTATVTIAGKPVPYRVTAGKITLKQDDGKKRAGIFHVSYVRTDAKDPAKRPVMFAFNGGPGSSAVWLHIGVLGPKIVKFPGDGTEVAAPPARVVDNPMSILDVCDLVFIDPVSTGYSRVAEEGKAEDFHGVKGDVASVADFIRRWVTENDRWASPKYLLGESYGGVRAAGLSDHLQSDFGMQLNGVVLLSTLLDFETLRNDSDLSHLVYLPSYAGVALHHGKIRTDDRDKFLNEVKSFAFGAYATGLLKGNSIGVEEKGKLAEQLARYTGIAAELWRRQDLRIDPFLFRAELLRDERKVIGRFDARVAWPAVGASLDSPGYDPSFSLVYGAFSTALMDYLGRGIGYKEERPYEVLTTKVNPWDWDSENKVLDLSGTLSEAMRDNPKLRILVLGGRTDLATPAEGVAHSLRHLPLPEASLAGRVTSVIFNGGHMFYLNQTDLAECREVLRNFILSEN